MGDVGGEKSKEGERKTFLSPGSNNLNGRLEGVIRQLESYLVVSFSGTSVGHVRTPLAFGNFNLKKIKLDLPLNLDEEVGGGGGGGSTWRRAMQGRAMEVPNRYRAP
jgi:hypothetical protein